VPVLSNPKHERFAQALAQGSSASAAYVEAGYSKSDSNASRLSGNEKVRARVGEILSEGAAKAGVTVQRIVDELAKVGFANMGDYLHATTGGDPFFVYDQLTDEQKAALSEVTVEDFKDGRGEDARDVRRIKFKLYDKLGGPGEAREAPGHVQGQGRVDREGRKGLAGASVAGDDLPVARQWQELRRAR
jgi:phage terminase small subunit